MDYKYTTIYDRWINEMIDPKPPKEMTDSEKKKLRRKTLLRKWLSKRHLQFTMTSIMNDRSRFIEGQKSRSQADLGAISREILASNLPILKTLQDFIRKIGSDKWKVRHDWVYEHRVSDRDEYGSLVCGTFVKKSDAEYSFTHVIEECNTYLYHAFGDLSSFASRGKPSNEHEITYINAIINKLQTAGKYLNLEEYEMTKRCHITGSIITEVSIATKVPLLRVDVKKRSVKTINTTILASSLASAIPIYENFDSVNLETGEPINGAKPKCYFTFEDAAVTRKTIGLNPCHYDVTVLFREDAEIGTVYFAVFGNRNFEDDFVSTRDMPHALGRAYRLGAARPLNYSTPPRITNHSFRNNDDVMFGLEVEVKSPYTKDVAILHPKDGKPMAPARALDVTGWAATLDSSIAPGFELKSPILTTKTSWAEQIPDGVKHTIDITAKDSRCGGHVHMSTTSNGRCFYNMQFWGWLFALIYPKRITNHYSSIVLRGHGYDTARKYQWMRLRNGTVEIRIFPAILKCENIYWRLDLLRKMHELNRKFNPKSVMDTIAIFLSSDGDELYRHVITKSRRKMVRSLLRKRSWVDVVRQNNTGITVDSDGTYLRDTNFQILDDSGLEQLTNHFNS